MDWNAFFAVIAWGITMVSGILTMGILINEACDASFDARQFRRSYFYAVMALLLVTLIGAATIGGMGWA